MVSKLLRISLLPSKKLVNKSKRKFQADIAALARLAGWLCCQTYDGRRSEPGFPHLVLVHPKQNRLFFVELKSMSGRLSAAQDRWLKALAIPAGADVRLWKPSDWDEIEEALCRKRAT